MFFRSADNTLFNIFFSTHFLWLTEIHVYLTKSCGFHILCGETHSQNSETDPYEFQPIVENILLAFLYVLRCNIIMQQNDEIWLNLCVQSILQCQYIVIKLVHVCVFTWWKFWVVDNASRGLPILPHQKDDMSGWRLWVATTWCMCEPVVALN